MENQGRFWYSFGIAPPLPVACFLFHRWGRTGTGMKVGRFGRLLSLWFAATVITSIVGTNDGFACCGLLLNNGYYYCAQSQGRG